MNWIMKSLLVALVPSESIPDMFRVSVRGAVADKRNTQVSEPPPNPDPEPKPVPKPKPVPQIVSLKILTPERISVIAYQKIDVPIILENKGTVAFNDLSLISQAFVNEETTDELIVELDRNNFSKLSPGDEERLNMTVYLNTSQVGTYDILVNVTSKTPFYSDWGKIIVDLEKVNETSIGDMILFTEEFITRNPQCIEIKELIDEAKKLFDEGEIDQAKLRAEQALRACEVSISQVSIPRPAQRTDDLTLPIYLLGGMLISMIMGLVYYLIKRRKIASKKEKSPENKDK